MSMPLLGPHEYRVTCFPASSNISAANYRTIKLRVPTNTSHVIKYNTCGGHHSALDVCPVERRPVDVEQQRLAGAAAVAADGIII